MLSGPEELMVVEELLGMGVSPAAAGEGAGLSPTSPSVVVPVAPDQAEIEGETHLPLHDSQMVYDGNHQVC